MLVAKNLRLLPILCALSVSLSCLPLGAQNPKVSDLPPAQMMGISEDLRTILAKNNSSESIEEFRKKPFLSQQDQQISAYILARRWQKQNVAATKESLAEPFSLYAQAGHHSEIGSLARLQGAELALASGDETKVQEILLPIYQKVKKFAASLDQNPKAVSPKPQKIVSEGVYRLCESYFRTQQFDKALEGLNLVNDVYPGSAYAKGGLFYKAEIASAQNGDPKTILDNYVAYVKAAPDGRNAIAAAQKILDTGEPTPDVYAALAKVYYVNSNWQRALDYWKKSGTANILESVCLMKLKQKQEAVNAFSAYLADPENNFSSVTSVATQLAKPLTKAEALELWKKVLNSKASTEAKADALWNVALRSTAQEAIPHYQQILAKFPTCQYAPESAWWVIWNQIKNSGGQKPRLDIALASCHKAIKLYGGTDYAPKYFYWSGKIHEMLKSPEQKNLAITAYKATQEKFGGTYYAYRAEQRLNALSGKADRHWQIHPGRNEPDESWNWPESGQLFDWAQVQSQAGLTPILLAAAGEYEECLNQMPESAPRPFKAWIYLKAGKAIKALNAVSLPLEGKPVNTQSPLWKMAYPLAYGQFVEKESRKNSMDPLLVHALIRQESRYDPNALSRSHAMGLMQLLLGTAQGVAKHNGIVLSSNNQVFEPPTNIALGTAYLAYVLKRHNGNPMLAVASYNGGPNAAAKWMREFQAQGGGDQDFLVENIPFQETRDYVRKVFANYWTYENLYLKKEIN